MQYTRSSLDGGKRLVYDPFLVPCWSRVLLKIPHTQQYFKNEIKLCIMHGLCMLVIL